MTSYFDKWGLSPQERRLVVGVGIAVFVVINFWLIIPKFGEFGKLQKEIDRIQSQQLGRYKAEIANKPIYEAKIKELLSKSGTDVPTEEAALRIYDEVNTQVMMVGVNINSLSPMARTSGKTNAFFDETSVGVDFHNTGEKELIDFLYHMADRELLIRAKSMVVGPDITRTRLQGKLTLVKSYQRKPPPKAAQAPAATKPAATAKPTNAPAARPTTNTAARPLKPVPQSGGTTNKPKP